MLAMGHAHFHIFHYAFGSAELLGVGSDGRVVVGIISVLIHSRFQAPLTPFSWLKSVDKNLMRKAMVQATDSSGLEA